MYIQRKRTKNWSLDKECEKLGISRKDVVYCGRGSKYGNPFSVNEYGLKISLAMFRVYIGKHPELFAKLKGKVLMCWCSKENYDNGLCHCSIITRIVNK